jgi:Bacterial Ig-like domain (group 3)
MPIGRGGDVCRRGQLRRVGWLVWRSACRLPATLWGVGAPAIDTQWRPSRLPNVVTTVFLWALVVFLVPISGAAAAPAMSADSGPVNGGSLTDGVPVSGSVTSADGIAYTFVAVAGQHLTLSITAPMVPSGQLNMEAIDASGAVDAAPVGFNTSPTELDFTPTPTQAGTTTVLISPVPGTTTGTFTLTYATDIIGALKSEVPVPTTIGIAGQRTAYTFKAVAGHHVTLAITHPMVPTGSFDLEAVDPSGAVVASPVGFNTSGVELDFTPSETETLTVVIFPVPGETTGTFTLTYSVLVDPTSTSVGCSPSSVAIGSTTSCTATVTDTASSGASTPTGIVSFASLPTTGAFGNSGTCTLQASDLSATASCSLTFAPSVGGSYTITGSYSGDGGHDPSSVIVVVPAVLQGTSTALVSSANPSTTGQTATYTATVSPVPDDGTVAFTDGGATIAGCGAIGVSSSTGEATCQATYPTTGSHPIQASYSGDANFAASQSATLDQRVIRSALVPSHTKITKATIGARKHTASFRFIARGASGFQCELTLTAKKGHKTSKVRYSSCQPPQTYRHLKAGRYTFLVRGVNHTGADPTPARKTFTID